MRIKQIIQLWMVAILACILIACSRHQADAYDSQGKSIRLSQYMGKWVIINYWATWCSPCLTEMPVLEKLSRQYKNKLVVLGVSFDKLDNREINKIAKRYSLTYSLLPVFPLQKLGVASVSILPITFIINRQGELIKTLKGPQTKEQLMQAMDFSHG